MIGRSAVKRFWVVGLMAVVLFVPPLFVRSEYTLNLVFLVGLYSIMAHSWNIFGGFCGQISLGHAAFFGAGALAGRYIWIYGFPYPLALPVGGVAAMAVACLVGVPSLKLKSHYFAIGTLALAMIALITVQNTLPGVSLLPPELIASYSLTSRYYLMAVTAVFTVILVYGLAHSKLGLAMLSIREDEEAAESIGINTFKYKIISMILSSFVAGVAGGLFAIYNVSFYRYVPFELWWSFDPLLITFIGGSGTVLGPLLGAICYVILREIFALSMGQVSVIIFGAVFILMVLCFPKGLIGLLEKFGRRTTSITK
ncbi:MAG: branched-chain amino acid ABC transporter permease [Pseudomonadota bacterium]